MRVKRDPSRIAVSGVDRPVTRAVRSSFEMLPVARGSSAITPEAGEGQFGLEVG